MAAWQWIPVRHTIFKKNNGLRGDLIKVEKRKPPQPYVVEKGFPINKGGMADNLRAFPEPVRWIFISSTTKSSKKETNNYKSR